MAERKRRLGRREVARLFQRGAEHEVGVRVIGPYGDGGLHFFGGLVEIAALPVDDAERVVRLRQAADRG